MSERRNLYFFHKEEPMIREKIEDIRKDAIQMGYTIVKDYKQADVIACFGGDGTFLQGVRRTSFREDCLYLGISTSDQLSLYCDFHIDKAQELIEAMKSQVLEVRHYPTIEVTVDNQASFYCLNEFSIQSNIVKTFIMDIYINDIHFETFRGDGIIVSTPTGSTAYNKSVNGAVIDPLLSCMQITELGSLNNNQFRTLGSPFILSSEKILTLKIAKEGNEHPTMAVDNEALGIQHVEKIQVKQTDKKIKTIKLKNNSFWEKVKKNFL
ncbi:NAD kinase [Niallia endozanthoxylica]|uniref:NAD kinase n=1 Tax=Niallia endozanthoxylica TaxID=2036016 RepID=A0A5J5HWY7_9BACI|nr:NAD kinase [Niallia endozanthoxylica]KAA9027482.1 NAD kinase [Niallia endozanthoxylica]